MTRSLRKIIPIELHSVSEYYDKLDAFDWDGTKVGSSNELASSRMDEWDYLYQLSKLSPEHTKLYRAFHDYATWKPQPPRPDKPVRP